MGEQAVRQVALVLMLRGKAAGTINRLRRRYDPQSAAIISAHLTLAGLADTSAPCAVICQQISQVLASVRPFTIHIGEVCTFLPRSATVYAAVEPLDKLTALHDALHRCQCVEWQERYSFMPHVTITEYLSEEETSKVYRELVATPMGYSSRLDTVTLWEKGPAGRWEPIEQFRLGPARVK